MTDEELLGNSIEEELTPPEMMMRQSGEFTAGGLKAKIAAERGQSQ